MQDLPNTELGLATVKNRAVKGILTLTGRTALLQVISFFGFFFLTIFLGKAEIGLFFAVSELVAILGYFSDIGLAAALIQKKERPEIRDIRSTFTIQQTLVIALITLVFIFIPLLKNFFSIPESGIFLLYSLLVAFFLSSLKTIPSVLLERHLRFDLLVIVEIVETFLFYGLAVVLAWQGLGVSSYAWAILARGIVGVCLIYIISPWEIGFAFDFNSIKSLLRFGLAYQGNSLLAVIKDRMMNVFLWRIIGAEGVGILGWAQKWAQMPLRFIMDSVIKVTFPAYSRMQEDKRELTHAIEKTLYFISLFSFPALTGMVIIAKPLLRMIPQYEKWEVALFAFWLYAFNSAWASITTPLTNALSAAGRIKIVFKLMVMWTTLTWILYPILAIKFGYNGVAIGAAIIAFSSLVAIIVAKQYLDFNLIKNIKSPLIGTLIMGFSLYLLRPLFSANIFSLLELIAIGIVIYFSSIFFLVGQQFLLDTRRLFGAFRQHD